jgi:hypothetical protein
VKDLVTATAERTADKLITDELVDPADRLHVAGILAFVMQDLIREYGRRQPIPMRPAQETTITRRKK